MQSININNNNKLLIKNKNVKIQLIIKLNKKNKDPQIVFLFRMEELGHHLNETLYNREIASAHPKANNQIQTMVEAIKIL